LTLQHKRKQRADAETSRDAADDGSHVPLHAENRKKEKEKEYSRKVVKKVAVGWNHTLILTGVFSGGIVIRFCNLSFSYCGECSVLLELFSFTSSESVDKSEVFVWGRNHTGQLGTGNREDVLSPMLLSFATHMGITHIAAGGEHSVICDGMIVAVVAVVVVVVVVVEFLFYVHCATSSFYFTF
jgi:alpha-tubulin suppressor-like RCC1 family protein